MMTVASPSAAPAGRPADATGASMSGAVRDAVTSVTAALDRLSLEGYDTLDPVTARAAVEAWARISSRVAAHRLAATVRLDTLGAARGVGASDTGALLAGDFGGDQPAARREVRTAQALGRAAATRRALALGTLSADQARMIADTVAGLDPSVDPGDRTAVEQTLVGCAPELTLRELRRRCDRALAGVRPAAEVDAAEDATVEARERAARTRADFWMVDNRDGTHRGGFTLPDTAADMLRTALDALAAPRRRRRPRAVEAPPPAAVDGRDGMAEGVGPFFEREREEHRTRWGQAFSDLVSRLPTDRLPRAGGSGAVLVATIDHAALLVDLRATTEAVDAAVGEAGDETDRPSSSSSRVATTSAGGRLSAAAARMLACRVGILPMVLGGPPLPLDLGRAQRLFSPTQRLALAHRDAGCTFPRCERPPAWCEAHHWRTGWAAGGRTDLADGILLCPHHHHLLHDQPSRWRVCVDEHGRPRVRAREGPAP